MKFGKSLSNQIEGTLPEWRDKFLSYKELKQRLKLVISASAAADRPPRKRARVADDAGSGGVVPVPPSSPMTREEEEFTRLLDAELDKFNSFFIEKEEEYIIRQKELQDRAATAAAVESMFELMRVRKEIVDLHGEMVLLENYSALNYTGLVKILKKYDKRTGAVIRQSFIQKVLQQPFFTTDVLYKLVKRCEAMLDQLLGLSHLSVSCEDAQDETDHSGVDAWKPGPSLINGSGSLDKVPDIDHIEKMEDVYMKSTLAALRSLKEVRSKSSTVSEFSLPPLQGEIEFQ